MGGQHARWCSALEEVSVSGEAGVDISVLRMAGRVDVDDYGGDAGVIVVDVVDGRVGSRRGRCRTAVMAVVWW